jgi:hypothetical protein
VYNFFLFHPVIYLFIYSVFIWVIQHLYFSFDLRPFRWFLQSLIISRLSLFLKYLNYSIYFIWHSVFHFFITSYFFRLTSIIVFIRILKYLASVFHYLSFLLSLIFCHLLGPSLLELPESLSDFSTSVISSRYVSSFVHIFIHFLCYHLVILKKIFSLFVVCLCILSFWWSGWVTRPIIYLSYA